MSSSPVAPSVAASSVASWALASVPRRAPRQRPMNEQVGQMGYPGGDWDDDEKSHLWIDKRHSLDKDNGQCMTTEASSKTKK